VAILVDLYLSDCRGIDTFDRLSRAAPNIPVLVLIEPQDEKTANLAVQSGAHTYLFKTCLNGQQLRKTVSNMIERAAYSEMLFEDRSVRIA